MDDYLATMQYPNQPNWARAYTPLPNARVGQAYYHVIIEGEDFWEPEGDEINHLMALYDAPAWLTITEDATNQGYWVLRGIPQESELGTHAFALAATDVYNNQGEREVEIEVLEADEAIADQGNGEPQWVSNPIAYHTLSYENFSTLLIRGKEFEDFDGDVLSIEKISSPSWLSLEQLAPNVWKLNDTPACEGVYTLVLSLYSRKRWSYPNGKSCY